MRNRAVEAHKFKIGNQVRLVRLASTNTAEAFLNMVTTINVMQPQDIWQISCLLPADSNGFQYQIKRVQEGPERRAREEQLQPA